MVTREQLAAFRAAVQARQAWLNPDLTGDALLRADQVQRWAWFECEAAWDVYPEQPYGGCPHHRLLSMVVDWAQRRAEASR